MTAYRAVGKVPVDATDSEKQAALFQAISDAVFELHDLGMNLDAISDTLADAYQDLSDYLEARSA